MSNRITVSVSLALASVMTIGWVSGAVAAEQTSGVPMNVAKRLDDRKVASPGVEVVPKSERTLREAKSSPAEAASTGPSTPAAKSPLSGIPMVQAKRL